MSVFHLKHQKPWFLMNPHEIYKVTKKPYKSNGLEITRMKKGNKCT